MQIQTARISASWTADLGPFSYATRPNPHYIGGKPYIGGKLADIGIIFPAYDEAICYFVTESQNLQLGHREKLDEASSFSLELVAFDTKTGVLRYRKQLPAKPRFTLVAVTKDRNLVVRSGDILRLYSPGFEVLKERVLGTKDYDVWTLKVSPSGSTMLLDHYYPFDTHDEILSTRAFDSLFKFKVEFFPNSSITDNVLLKSSDTKQIFASNFASPLEAVPIPKTISCVGDPVLVNDAEVLNACGQQVTLISRSGQVLMQDMLDRKEHLEQLVSLTPDGRFAAVSARQNKGGFMDYSSIKRSHTRILIYDTELRRRVASVPVEPIPQKDYDFALAPAGDTLVVMADNSVKAYSVSPQMNFQETVK